MDHVRSCTLTLIVLFSALAAGCGDSSGTVNSSATANANGVGSPGSSDKPIVLSGPTMGTTYAVKYFPGPDGPSRNELQQDIDETLRQINDRMSTWQEESELSRFNRFAGTEWFTVSRETVLVVAEAERISKLSGGTFDVTVGPLLGMWGFGPHAQREQIPTAEEIAAVRLRIGYEKIHVRHNPPALRKDHGEMKIVLSGIAKGYAVDRVGELLRQRGVSAYMVEIGGEILTRGTKPDGPWKVGIEKPTAGRRELQKRIELTDLAMATSGDYRNYFERNGKRYSHTIDPRTGRPIEHRLAAVTVIDTTCMRADALATALMVLGPVDGYNLAVEQELAAYLLVREGDTFTEKMTPRFVELFERPRETK